MCEKRFTEKKDGKNILRNGIVSVHSDGFGSFYEGDAIDRLAEYETALEEGKLVILPRKECEGEILFKAKRKNWRELPKDEWWVEGVPIKIKGEMYMAVEYIDSEQNSDFEMAQYILQKSFIAIAQETLCQVYLVADLV